MRFKYLLGAIGTNIYRFLQVFPNSDPIMGFVVGAAKNEKIWKAPLFAFFTMYTFDFFTSGIGIWTFVSSTTYAMVALFATFYLKEKKSNFKNYYKTGILGVLLFDFITGPIMSTFLFEQSFVLTIIMQIPFTIMHLISVVFAITIITPFLDKQLMKEATFYYNNFKQTIVSRRIV